LILFTKYTGETAPTPGALTFSYTSNVDEVVMIALRLSGVDPDTQIEATQTYDSEGSSSTNLSLGITTLTDKAWALALASTRQRTITLPEGQGAVHINETYNAGGSSSDISTGHVWQVETSPAGAVTLGGSGILSSATNGIMAVVAIKPAPTPVSASRRVLKPHLRAGLGVGLRAGS
jgi:hypothetical protein